MKTIPILCFTDILCVWAYIAQLRVDHVKKTHGDKVEFDHRFCSVFGDTHRKITTTWSGRGGFEGFNAHLREAASAYPEVELNPDIWLGVRPASSMGCHLFVKAAQLAEDADQLEQGTTERLTWALRCSFFREARDIARWDVQCDVGRKLGVDAALVEPAIQDGRAYAALAADYQEADLLKIQGSPSFVLNAGRQKLYGNVGYRIIEANIQELLREPHAGEASWC